MKVILLNGSPKSKGCTYTALKVIENELLNEGIEVKFYEVGNRPVIGCIGCNGCRKLGKCVHDDLVNEVSKEMESADGFIVGSPVHYAEASGAATSFLDRLFYSTDKNHLRHMFAASIVSCRRGGASAAFDQLNKYFTINEMPIVSSVYWNQIHGNTPEEVVQDLEGIRTMKVLARNMAYLIKCKEAAKNVPLPELVPVERTNFIR